MIMGGVMGRQAEATSVLKLTTLSQLQWKSLRSKDSYGYAS
jgi:hypothetical protein